ncbi:hypothetical protein [Microbacterium sp.]|uniref:hypothetical protein n=1 Tax=Microbacterium sp. TaxID=51671 RepID=UPI0039E64F59
MAADAHPRVAHAAKSRGHETWRGTALICVLVAALAAASGWALAFRPVPDAAAITDTSQQYPLVSTTFADSRHVAVTFVDSGSPVVRLNDAGTVTAQACTPGDSWASGSTPISIDGRRILALATSTPLYRDLLGGESGDDVVGVQAALVALGKDVPQSGHYDDATRRAVAALLEANGIAEGASPGALLLRSVLWLPVSPFPIANCALTLGQVVGVGVVIATGEAAVATAQVTMPVGLEPGDRTLTIDDATVAVDSTGRITDAGQLQTLLSQPTVSTYVGVADPESVGVPAPTGTLALASPIDAFAVPPSALSDVVGNDGCVWGSGGGIRVRILSSSLGLTYIAFADDQEVPSSVLVRAPIGKQCD